MALIYNDRRPIITDLSFRQDSIAAGCQIKTAYIVGVSFHFTDELADGLDERIVLKNTLGKVDLVARKYDGRWGYVDYSSAPMPCGKAKVYLATNAKEGFRRCRCILWVKGARRDWHSVV